MAPAERSAGAGEGIRSGSATVARSIVPPPSPSSGTRHVACDENGPAIESRRWPGRATCAVRRAQGAGGGEALHLVTQLPGRRRQVAFQSLALLGEVATVGLDLVSREPDPFGGDGRTGSVVATMHGLPFLLDWLCGRGDNDRVRVACENARQSSPTPLDVLEIRP